MANLNVDKRIFELSPFMQRVYVCVSVCLYLCMKADKYVCMYVCVYACMYVRMYVCMYVCAGCRRGRTCLHGAPHRLQFYILFSPSPAVHPS